MINFKSITLIIMAFILYILSFIHFIGDLDKENINYAKSKTIVVLTGNKGRLKAAIDLMILNNDARLFISGVAKGVKYSEIIKNKKIDQRKVDLDYNAQSTFGNAVETKAWIEKNNLNDFILITDGWHMKRALLLFKNSMPHVEIFPYKLKSKKIYLKENFIFEEHLKYLISHIQVIYLWIIN